MRPEVSVFVPTYNRKEYIEQALQSIFMQEVTFSYEIVFHDDASTDGTAEILKQYENKYPNIVRGVYQKENQFSKGNLAAIWNCQLEMCRGKYCAMLEADDYWIDKHKLQKQYDYMETHPECALYMHNAWKLDMQTGKKELLNTFSESGYYSQRDQVICGLGSKFPATGSFFFIMEYLRVDLPEFVVKAGVGDYPIRQIVANKGKVYYDEQPMSVYRYMSTGSFMKEMKDHLDIYINYVIKMSMFYKQFSEYLDFCFDDIYAKKIDSDILGLAAATCDHREMIPDIGENWLRERLNDCFDLLEGNGWIEAVKDRSSSDETIWIYGTSRLGACCKHSLEKMVCALRAL